jgi:hypothetical protein
MIKLKPPKPIFEQLIRDSDLNVVVQVIRCVIKMKEDDFDYISLRCQDEVIIVDTNQIDELISILKSAKEAS